MKFKTVTMNLITVYFVFLFSSDTAPHNNTTEQATRNKKKVLPATGTAFQSGIGKFGGVGGSKLQKFGRGGRVVSDTSYIA